MQPDELEQEVEVSPFVSFRRRRDDGDAIVLVPDGTRRPPCDPEGTVEVVALPRVWIIRCGPDPERREREMVAFDRKTLRPTGVYRGDLPEPGGAPLVWSWATLVLLGLSAALLVAALRTVRRMGRLGSFVPALVDSGGVAHARGEVHPTAGLPEGPALLDVAPTSPTYRSTAAAPIEVLPGTAAEWTERLDRRARALALLAITLVLAALAPLLGALLLRLVVSMPWTS